MSNKRHIFFLANNLLDDNLSNQLKIIPIDHNTTKNIKYKTDFVLDGYRNKLTKLKISNCKFVYVEIDLLFHDSSYWQNSFNGIFNNEQEILLLEQTESAEAVMPYFTMLHTPKSGAHVFRNKSTLHVIQCLNFMDRIGSTKLKIIKKYIFKELLLDGSYQAAPIPIIYQKIRDLFNAKLVLGQLEQPKPKVSQNDITSRFVVQVLEYIKHVQFTNGRGGIITGKLEYVDGTFYVYDMSVKGKFNLDDILKNKGCIVSNNMCWLVNNKRFLWSNLYRWDFVTRNNMVLNMATLFKYIKYIKELLPFYYNSWYTRFKKYKNVAHYVGGYLNFIKYVRPGESVYKETLYDELFSDHSVLNQLKINEGNKCRGKLYEKLNQEKLHFVETMIHGNLRRRYRHQYFFDNICTID
jgi:hypothetical protein